MSVVSCDHLFDLPWPLLEALIWPVLVTHAASRQRHLKSYRLVCKIFHHLVDEGLGSFSLDLTTSSAALHRTSPASSSWVQAGLQHLPWRLPWLAPSHHDPSPPSIDEAECRLTDAASMIAAQESDMRRCGAFLSRLPGLSSLTLCAWGCEAEAVAALRRCGQATHGQVTRLELSGSRLSPNGVAAHLHFTQLRHLSVCTLHGGGHDWVTPVTPDGGLFNSLLHGDLTQLTYHDDGAEGSSMLRGLGALSRLERLDLRLWSVDGSELRLLTGLASLRHLRIKTSIEGAFFLHDFNPLLRGSQQLTSLQLLRMAFEETWSAYGEFFALLGGLRRLCLGGRFLVDDAAWAVVSGLTRLTHLGVGGIELTPPAPPQQQQQQQRQPTLFPQLQQLSLGSEFSYPPLSGLLRSIEELLPLPALVGLQLSHLDHSHLAHNAVQLDHGHRAHDAAQEEVALSRLVRFVADAPRLQLGDSWEFVTQWSGAGHLLSHVMIAACMQPLAGRVAFTMSP